MASDPRIQSDVGDAFLPFTHLAKETLGADPSDKKIELGEKRLRERLVARTRRRRRAYAALMVAAMLALVIGGWRVTRPAPALTYHLDNAGSGDDGYVRAAIGQGSAQVHFSDGTELAFVEGSTGRIETPEATGTRIALESGSVHVHVIHRDGAKWAVKAGPFEIAVTGTEFDTSWFPEKDSFEVSLHRGTVIIHGPFATEGVTLKAGQTFSADLRSGSARIDESPPPQHAFTKEIRNDAIDPPLAPNGSPGAFGNPKSRTTSVSWPKSIAAGDFETVLKEADARGLDVCLTTSPRSDLGALADAARYGGRSELARRSYLAMRSRFPNSPEAHQAAFLIGRLADSNEGPDAAIRWYDTYLSESPSGSFAAEALGRKMIATERSGGSEKAKPLANQYLQNYPTGPFGDAARAIRAKP